MIIALSRIVGIAQNIDSLDFVANNSENSLSKVEALFQIASIYQFQQENKEFNTIIQKAIKISLDSKNDTLISTVYSMIGTFYEDKGDFSSALGFYLKSLNILEKLGYEFGICEVSKNLAVVYKQLKNADEAFKYLNKAKIYINNPEVRNSYLPRSIYLNLAETFCLLNNNLDSALIYIQKANEVVNKKIDQFGYSRILSNFASIYSSLGDIDLADTYFNKAIVYSDSTDQKINYVQSVNEYAIFLRKNKHLRKAKMYSLIAFSKVQKMPNEILKLEVAKTASIIFGDLMQYDSAFYFSCIKDSLQNSLLGSEKINYIQAATLKQQLYETEQAEIKLRNAADRKHFLQYLFIGFFIIALFTLYIIFSHSFLFNSTIIKFFGTIALLLIFEFINLLIHPFIISITSHSPILIFSFLVIIAGLLVPLHHKLEKYIIDKLIYKNKIVRQTKAIKILEEIKEIN